RNHLPHASLCPPPHATLLPQTLPPAAFVGPSVPSVPPLSTTIPFRPSISRAAARANSWFRPPKPAPRIVTVVSPPEIIQAGERTGLELDRTSLALTT